MIADVASSGEVSCSEPTFDDYVGALKKLFVICDVEAWCPAIRSKTAIRSGLKRAFVDPSIAVAALGLTPESLMVQLNTFGFIFEQMCIRDLKAYTLDIEPHLSYYHDRYGLEADWVLHLGDGRYALIECKLGSREIEDGAGHLVELKRLIREHNKDEKQMPIREPDLMIVFTGGKIAYTRPDGASIKVIEYFEKEIDYRGNVHNSRAKAFYEKRGAKVLEMSLEKQKPKKAELMRTKHCIKFALKKCKSPEKLFLEDEYGQKYPLEFDCKNCEMILKMP